MSSIRLITVACLLGIALLFSGCVELIGQRIVLWHDVERDTLHLLLFYDGVHDSGDDTHGDGREQLPQFVESSSVLLLDWIGHVDMNALRQSVDDETLEPEAREVIRFILQKVTTQPIGHYRDAHGRIGAMQHVQIEQASSFLRHINAGISSMVTNNLSHHDPEDPMARTHELARAAAEQDHQWITLDGQALRIEFPVHTFEWRHIKADALRQLADADRDEVTRVVQALSAFSAAYDDTGGHVRIVIGERGAATTLRFRLRDDYEPSLEQLVMEHAPLELPGLWRTGRPVHAAAVTLYKQFAPPEQQVMDTLNRINRAEGRTPEEGLRLIEQYVQSMSDHAYPAPRTTDDLDEAIDVWKTWTRQMMAYPTSEF